MLSIPWTLYIRIFGASLGRCRCLNASSQMEANLIARLRRTPTHPTGYQSKHPTRPLAAGPIPINTCLNPMISLISLISWWVGLMYPYVRYVRYVRNRASPLAKVNPFRALSGRGLQGFLRGYNLWPGSAAIQWICGRLSAIPLLNIQDGGCSCIIMDHNGIYN